MKPSFTEALKGNPAPTLAEPKLGSVPNFKLYLIADREVIPDERMLLDRVEKALAAGVKAVRLRDRHSSTREILSIGKKLRALTDDADAEFFVSDRLDLFWSLNADGIHVPEEGVPVSILRKELPHRWIGKSVHSLEGAKEAEKDGADFITFSPIFDTPSKMGILKPRGLAALEEVCRTVKIPVLGLGGISPKNVQSVLTAGASGIAVIRSILNEPSIERAVADFKGEMREL